MAGLNYGICRTLIVEYEAVKAAGFMDERYPKFDGLWLTIKLAAFCRFAYVHRPLVLKREHPASDSRRNTRQDVLRDLFGIYGDMQPLLASLDERRRHAVNADWQATIRRYSAACGG